MPTRRVIPFEPHVVGSFGGGLELSKHPAYIRDDQSPWMSGFICRDGYAEMGNNYSQLVAAIGGAGEIIVGMIQNPFTLDGAIVGTVDAAGPPAALRLYGVTGAGVVTTIANSAVGGKGLQSGVLRGAFVGGKLIVVAGLTPNIGGALSYDGTTAGALGFTADLITPFRSHVVIAVSQVTGTPTVTASDLRRVAWSAANNANNFDPADLSGDADNAIIDDAEAGLSALVPLSADLVGLFTRRQLYVLIPTGGIPAFTIELAVSGIGAQQIASASANRRQSFFGSTPFGAVFYGADNLYLTNGSLPQAIGTPIFRYYTQLVDPNLDPANDYNQPYVWHESLGTLIVPRIVTGTTQMEGLHFHARTQAWSRVQWPTALITRQAFIYGYSTGSLQRRHWLSAGRTIYIEDFGTSFPGSFIDTKDFALPEPTRDQYIDRIKVDWEPLNSATTDALQVYAASHNDLSASILGSSGLETQALPFTLLGTLTGGKSELAVRIRAKYIRFRFQQVPGSRIRIRGFTLMRRRGSPRLT